MTSDSIKSMKLYSDVERIHADLKAAGADGDGPLDIELLIRFDQLHYHGVAAVDLAIEKLGVRAGDRVLDIGSGFGGPARWIAHRTGAHVTAVELQHDLHQTAAALTARCGLSERVEHRRGDILETPLDPTSFDHAVSWLTLYHIPRREPLFARIVAALRPGGNLYVEDLFLRAETLESERRALASMLYAQTLHDREAYQAELAAAGFTAVDFRDQTEDWAAFTADRLRDFRSARAEKEALYGEPTVADLDDFYETIANLLAGGRLGGVRLTAAKSR